MKVEIFRRTVKDRRRGNSYELLYHLKEGIEASGDEAVIPSLGHLFHMGIQVLGSDPYRYEEFALVWEKYCNGDFDPSIDSVYELKDGAEAHRKMESNDVSGKFILTL